MHAMLAVHIEGAEPAREREILDRLPAAFAEYPSVRVFPDTWVIRLEGFGLYERVDGRLRELARGTDDATVRFLLSPLLSAGPYRGRVSADAAAQLPAMTA
jgi:hypothetical protein